MIADVYPVYTFCCELCGQDHTSGEAPFRVGELRCSEVNETSACIQRLRSRVSRTTHLSQKTMLMTEIEKMEASIDPFYTVKQELMKEHSLHRIHQFKLTLLWGVTVEWLNDAGFNNLPTSDSHFKRIAQSLISFGRVF